MLPLESTAMTFSFHVTWFIARSTSLIERAAFSAAIPSIVSTSRFQIA